MRLSPRPRADQFASVADVNAVPPVSGHHPDVGKRAAQDCVVAKRRHDQRIVLDIEAAESRNVHMIVMIVTEHHDVDRRQFFENDSGLRQHLRAWFPYIFPSASGNRSETRNLPYEARVGILLRPDGPFSTSQTACAAEGEAGRDLATAKDNSPPFVHSFCEEKFCRTQFTRRQIGDGCAAPSHSKGGANSAERERRERYDCASTYHGERKDFDNLS
jgi:hypothetical protein